MLLVSGDISLSHIVLQKDDANVYDRFVQGWKINDYYVPGGTYLLEFMLDACRRQRLPESSDAEGDHYFVRGPFRRRWVAPHFPKGVIDIRSFPMDTTTVRLYKGNGNDPGASYDAYRVKEGLGLRKGDYVSKVERLAAQRPIDFDEDLWKYYRPGKDDNLGYLIHTERASLAGNRAYVHVLNLEFADFGTDGQACAANKVDPPSGDRDHIGTSAGITDIEGWIASEKNFIPDHLAYVVKVKNRSAWTGMRDPKEREIRESLCSFLCQPILADGSAKGHRRDRTIVVVSADELRQGNVYISNHLSWERTIQSATLEMKTVETQVSKFLNSPEILQKFASQPGYATLRAGEEVVLHDTDSGVCSNRFEGQLHPRELLWQATKNFAYGFLILPKHLVITFACDGAIYLETNWALKFVKGDPAGNPKDRLRFEWRPKAAYLALEPTVTEGSHFDRYPGRMRGFDTVVTTALAHYAMESCLRALRNPGAIDAKTDLCCSVRNGLKFGLKAGRFMQSHGYDIFDSKAWSEIRKSVVGELPSKKKPTFTIQEAGQKMNLYRERLFPFRLAHEFVTRQVAELSQWAMPPVEGRPAVPDGIPVMPFDAVTSVIVHHSIKRFDSAGLITEEGTTEVADRLNVFRGRQETEWRNCGFIQDMILADSSTLSELISDGVDDWDPKMLQAWKRAGYGSFDRRWWSLAQASIGDALADCFTFPPVRWPAPIDRPHPAAPVPTDPRAVELMIFEPLPDDLRRARNKSLILAYAVLNFGMDVLHPRKAEDVTTNLCKVLFCAIDADGSIDAYCNRIPRREAIRTRVNDVLRALVPTGIDPEVIRGVETCFNDKYAYIGDPEKAQEALETIHRNLRKSPKHAVNQWMGLFPLVKIGALQSIERREVESYRVLEEIMREYIKRIEDVRPLNIGVFGPAGSGKSFAVREIAKSVLGDPDKLAVLVFNLSQFRGPEDLVDAFEEIQDAGIQGRLPIVFWDEYDSQHDGPLGWLSYFLGPMNDGLYFRKERSRKLPKCIFVFAGSMFDEFTDMHRLDYELRSEMARRNEGGERQTNQDPHEKQLADDGREVLFGRFTIKDWAAAKGPDFKSRLTGCLDVLGVNALRTPDPLLRPRFDRYGHFIRRALTLRNLLKQIQPELFDAEGKLRIPPNVSRGFIEIEQYFHGNRSIEQILRMCDFGDAKVFEYACLPSASQFLIHANPSDWEILAETMRMRPGR
ncbi:MAG TPA: hypothetical protein VHE55_02960 [Fimbriimonadaceae bacterium]|nr:hypothetical protein [Fimbriimonadaceae bacterium]